MHPSGSRFDDDQSLSSPRGLTTPTFSRGRNPWPRGAKKEQTCDRVCSIGELTDGADPPGDLLARNPCPLSQMYHTFTVTSPRVRTQANDGTDQPRISTTTACLECRRKKTRCGGGQPCQQCIGIERPELCKYARRARKTMPSRRCV